MHWKRSWCWEGLGAGGEEDDRGWDGWMASPTQWTWVWVNSGSWWWTGRPGVLRFMGSQRVGHDWVTELNWGEGNGTPLQYSCLENPMDGAWWAAVHGVLKSQTRLKRLSSSSRNCAWGLLWCLTASARDLGSIPGSGRSPGEGNGNPLRYSCLEKSHGQRSLTGYSPWSHERVGHDLVMKQQQKSCLALYKSYLVSSCDNWEDRCCPYFTNEDMGAQRGKVIHPKCIVSQGQRWN